MSMAAAVTVSAATWLSASAEPGAVRLHLGTDTQRFSYGTNLQPLTVAKSSCAINSAEPLIRLQSTVTGGTRSVPGLSNYGLGVKAAPSSGNGSPCAQVDALETLTLSPGSSIAGRLFTRVELDLELTGNAIAKITVSNGTSNETYRLQTGTSITPAQLSEPDNDFTPPYEVSSSPGDETDACAAPNSSGPNNAGNDNCRWSIDPSFDFSSVTITTEIGTATLEGGGDFQNDPAHDSLFVLANAAPVAVNDNVTTNEDTPLTFDVRSNDTDGDGDTLSATSTSSPAHGVLTQPVAGGPFTYTPTANYNGSDSFTYSVTDGTGSSAATVSITVVPVNDPPVAISGPATTPEETPVTILVATDIDSTVLNASCTRLPAVGTITDLLTGSITFTPSLNFNGSVTITCDITDSAGAHSTAMAVVDVLVTPVNDPPIAQNDSAEVNQDLSLGVVIDVLGNDTDVDDTALVVTNLSAPSHGSVSTAGGVLTYTPTAGYSGDDSFTYTANDGDADSNTATVSVSVCTLGTVTDDDGAVTGTFTPLTVEHGCKQYAVDAVAANGTVLFTPEGAAQIDYRGYLSFGPKPAPLAGSDGVFGLLLKYDPAGGTTFRPVLWCDNPQFDGTGNVTTAILPSGESWCIASEASRGDVNGDVVTTWQVFGHDDPRFQ
jgi:hypothetical protein